MMPPRNRRARAGIVAALLVGFLAASGQAAAQSSGVQQADRRDAGDQAIEQRDGRRAVHLPPILAELFGRLPPMPLEPGGLPATPGNGGSAPSPDDSAASGQVPSAAASGANSPPAAAPRAIPGTFVPDEVLVTIEGDEQQAAAIAAAFGLEVRSVRVSELVGAAIVRYGIPDGRPVGFVLAQLAGDARTRQRVPNHLFTLQQAARIVNYAFQRISLDVEAASGEGIDIAVIDSAADATHPALSGAVVGTFDAMPDRPVETIDHATSIAGLIAGRGPFRGMAPGARLHLARAFEGGISSTDVLLAALDWSVGQGARIVNMSFVGPRNELFEAACRNAEARGILLVAAAGNNGPRAPFGYPAAYDSVIAVTATDVRDRLMRQANRGPYVFVAAPGVNVVAPIPGGGTGVVTGTSFAAAVATGAVANLLRNGVAGSPQEIGRLLADTAVDLGVPGRDDEFGFGLVNTREAMGAR